MVYRDPKEVLVKREDLLPVTLNEWGYLCNGHQTYDTVTAEQMRRRGLEALSVAVHLEDLEAEKAAEKAKQWELEHAVPLARTLYNTYHKYSDNYRDDVDEELWLQNYEEGNHLVTKWVAVAKATLKAQGTDGTD